MAYIAPNIKDQNVQYPNRFKIDGLSHTIEPDFGVVTEAGTPINRALLQPMADYLATTRHVKIKEYTGAANGVTQVNLDLSDVTFSNYAKVLVSVRNILRTTAGSSNIAVRLNGLSGTSYSYTYIERGFDVSFATGQSSFNSSGSTLDFTNTVSENIDIELLAMGNYLYANIYAAKCVVFGKCNVGSAATFTALNMFTYSSNIIKSGMKFYVYGVLK